MNYKEKRFILIYNALGDELRKKFISEYNVVPFGEETYPQFRSSMSDFLAVNRDEPQVIAACLRYPEPNGDPVLDSLLEKFAASPEGLLLIMLYRIDRLEAAIAERNRKISEQKQEPAPGLNEKISSIADDIYKKLFEPPVSTKKYQLLTKDEIEWIKDHAGLSKENSEMFQLCCESDSLAAAAEKIGISLSKVKRCSSAIMEQIKTVISAGKTFEP